MWKKIILRQHKRENEKKPTFQIKIIVPIHMILHKTYETMVSAYLWQKR